MEGWIAPFGPRPLVWCLGGAEKSIISTSSCSSPCTDISSSKLDKMLRREEADVMLAVDGCRLVGGGGCRLEEAVLFSSLSSSSSSSLSLLLSWLVVVGRVDVDCSASKDLHNPGQNPRLLFGLLFMSSSVMVWGGGESPSKTSSWARALWA